MKTTMKALFVILFLAIQAYPQKYLEKEFKGGTNPDELVTLSPNVSFNQAIALLSKISESVTGKKIVSTVDSDEPIGIEIIWIMIKLLWYWSSTKGLFMKKRKM